MILKLIWYFILSFIHLPYAFSQEQLCSDVFVHGKLDLSEIEKNLVCGDSEMHAYQDIPAYQASYFLRGFLQSRGYLQPEFEKVKGVLHVHIGSKSYVRKIIIISGDEKESFLIAKRVTKLFKKRLLTTSLLNSIEAEALSLLRQRGFPCSQVRSEVDVSQSTVVIYLDQLNFHKFGLVERESIKGLRSNALDRYYPFDSDHAFNEELLLLTEKRMFRAEVVQGTYFLENCSDEARDFSLSQHFIIGPPRTIRFGVGASTELGPMARVKWSNNRYGDMASNLSANLQSSFRSQSLNLSADTFLWKEKSRQSLLSQIEILRESQLNYEQLVFRIDPHMKWTRDRGAHHHYYTLGPSYETGTYHSKGDTTRSFATGAFKGAFQWMAHQYELFDIHPQEGDLFGFRFDFRHPTFGFSDPMIKLDSTFVKIARLTNMGRGTLIGGTRFNAGTTWVSDDQVASGLPPAVKFYGGGSEDNRGYILQTLPRNAGVGALSKLGFKLELRRTHFFRESVEAFTFLDGSYFGDKSWSILPQLWYAPGVGIRWLSPIGLVQAFAAKALASSPYKDHGHLLYLGLGGGF